MYALNRIAMATQGTYFILKDAKESPYDQRKMFARYHPDISTVFEYHKRNKNVELRSVLTKKKGFERDRIERIENRISSRTTVSFPDASDVMAANRLQSETLLYPMDALVLAAAEAVDATLVSFDGELVEHGAVRPADVSHSGD